MFSMEPVSCACTSMPNLLGSTALNLYSCTTRPVEGASAALGIVASVRSNVDAVLGALGAAIRSVATPQKRSLFSAITGSTARSEDARHLKAAAYALSLGSVAMRMPASSLLKCVESRILPCVDLLIEIDRDGGEGFSQDTLQMLQHVATAVSSQQESHTDSRATMSSRDGILTAVTALIRPEKNSGNTKRAERMCTLRESALSACSALLLVHPAVPVDVCATVLDDVLSLVDMPWDEIDDVDEKMVR